ncbi:nuclear protein export protein Yrb2 [Paecilomyces variotii No. 5]|uniref:Nuclear protein export protein Yrb2 n=1 Tax=Byssochlamys spectabilis (strain No. 5 / NBRC 109023) TaxID=1356009 RepID=V5FP95_BYSSN|nr:nuclear protein export protein Yrb2 [Paecilomyces variotii No. 5]
MASDTQEHNGASAVNEDHVTSPPDNTSSPNLPSSPTSEDKEIQHTKGTKEITPPPSDDMENKVKPEVNPGTRNRKEKATQTITRKDDAALFIILAFLLIALFFTMPAKLESNMKDVGTDTNEDSTTSDNDNTGERPVRQKLKETTIAGNTDTSKNTDTSDSRSTSRGRASRKRSFDDLQTENNDAASESKDENGHRRKRSRDSKEPTTPPAEQSKEANDASKILSPKKKRSLDQLEKDDAKAEEPAGKVTSKNGLAEPEKKRHRDNSQERRSSGEIKDEASKPSLPSAFANTSAVSPFASLAPKSKTEEPPKATHVTSASAFASSTFGAFASSAQSPFGSLGSSTPSIFKSPPTTESEKPASPGFAAAAGASSFAASATSGTSGFGTLGSGFSGFAAAAPKPGGGLTSFAAPGGPGLLGSEKAKPFGSAPDSSDEEGEQEEAKPGSELPTFEKDKEDERFFEQPIETGEEEEVTYFSCKAKLFGFSGKEWKERGLGTFKVNVREPIGEGKKTARLIMRADGVLRVMLNTPIFNGMTVGDPTGKEPSTKQLHLASLENGRSVPLLLRTGSNDIAKELYHVVRKLQEEL